MAARLSTSLAIFLTLNLIFFTLTTSTFLPQPTCRDSLKIGACVNALNLVKLKLGSPPVEPCCSLIQGLADLEAAVCLCTTLSVDLLGIRLRVPIDLSVLLNNCGKTRPSGFQCS